MKYIYPSWYYGNLKTLDEVVQAEKELPEIENKNKTIYQHGCTVRQQMLSDAKLIWGENNKVTKYLKNQTVPSPPSLNYSLNDVRRRIEKEIEKMNQEHKALEADKANKQLISEATLYLTQRGLVLGKDFTGDTAVQMANDIAFNEYTKEAERVCEAIDFQGQNCDGPCAGWIPGEHRCCCGNRRVSWAIGWGHSFKNPYVYAEAY